MTDEPEGQGGAAFWLVFALCTCGMFALVILYWSF